MSEPADREALRTEIASAVRRYADWTDANDADPGVTLLELFAWLAEELGASRGSGLTARLSDDRLSLHLAARPVAAE